MIQNPMMKKASIIIRFLQTKEVSLDIDVTRTHKSEREKAKTRLKRCLWRIAQAKYKGSVTASIVKSAMISSANMCDKEPLQE